MEKSVHLFAVLLVMIVVSSSAFSVEAQSDRELLETIERMRQQINSQQKQLELMEEQLKRRELSAAERSSPAVAEPASVIARKTDWYVGAFMGGAFTSDSDTTLVRNFTGGPFVNKAKNVGFAPSPVVGAKGGLCPALVPYLCVELDVDHFRPSIDEQFAQGAFAPNMDFQVWNLGLSALARTGFFPKSDYPLERQLHLYAGVGPSFVWTGAKEGTAPNGGKKDSDFDVGIQALVGVKYFLSKNMALSGEYKFKHWKAGPFHLGSDRFDSDSFNSNLFYLGLALHP